MIDKLNQRTVRNWIREWCTKLGVKEIHLPKVVYPHMIPGLFKDSPKNIIQSVGACDANHSRIILDKHMVKVGNQHEQYKNIVLTTVAHEVSHYVNAYSQEADGDYRSDEDAEEIAKKIIGDNFIPIDERLTEEFLMTIAKSDFEEFADNKCDE